MARLGSAVSYTDHDRATTLGTRSIALARELADPMALGYAIRCRLRGWFDPEAIAARREAAAELRALGSRLGNPLLEAWGLRWQGTMFEDGDLNLIEASMDSLWSLGERLHNPNHRWAAAMRRAAVMIQRGRLGEASVLQDTTAQAALQLDNMLVPLLETQRGLLDALTGASTPTLNPYDTGEAIFEDLRHNSAQWLTPDITRAGSDCRRRHVYDEVTRCGCRGSGLSMGSSLSGDGGRMEPRHRDARIDAPLCRSPRCGDERCRYRN